MTSHRFANKVAYITGAAGGLGRASAARLSAEGAQVVVVDRDEAAARETAAALPGESLALAADISNEDEVRRSVEDAVAHFGRIDVFHLNAGVFGSFVPLPDLELRDFTDVMAVNVAGQFLGLREAFRHYRARNAQEGSIVLTASIAGHRGSADLLPYQTSKHAVVGLIHGSAVYGGPLGIRVNGVAPGIVPTKLFAKAADQVGGGDDMVRRAQTTPLRRAGRAEEIAGVVAFLLSDDATYTTGEIVTADGGASIVNTVRPAGGAGAWDPAGIDEAMYGSERGTR